MYWYIGISLYLYRCVLYKNLDNISKYTVSEELYYFTTFLGNFRYHSPYFTKSLSTYRYIYNNDLVLNKTHVEDVILEGGCHVLLPLWTWKVKGKSTTAWRRFLVWISCAIFGESVNSWETHKLYGIHDYGSTSYVYIYVYTCISIQILRCTCLPKKCQSLRRRMQESFPLISL